MIVKANKISTEAFYLTVHLKIETKNQKIDHSKEENKIYFWIGSKSQKIYLSEADSDDGRFNMIQIPTWALGNDIVIIFYNSKNQQIGLFRDSIDNFKNNALWKTKNLAEL